MDHRWREPTQYQDLKGFEYTSDNSSNRSEHSVGASFANSHRPLEVAIPFADRPSRPGWPAYVRGGSIVLKKSDQGCQ